MQSIKTLSTKLTTNARIYVGIIIFHTEQFPDFALGTLPVVHKYNNRDTITLCEENLGNVKTRGILHTDSKCKRNYANFRLMVLQNCVVGRAGMFS